MPEIIIYATALDADVLRKWINSDPAVAWIVKISEHDRVYTWRAQSTIDTLFEQDYAIWHVASGRLNIPSGSLGVPDAPIPDPFAGWSQQIDRSGATSPWFGANLPGPYNFSFREAGRESTNSLGRSGFNWALDRFKAIGKPAHPDARRWWFRLKRFIATNATLTAWPSPSAGSHKAFVFPDAFAQIRAGRQRDVNP